MKFGLTVLISGLCLYFAAKKIEFAKIRQDLETMQPLYVLGATCISLMGLTLRALRWHQVVRRERAFAFSNTFWATGIGYLGNNILPARAGEIIRSVVLGLSSGIRKSLVLATALTERIIDAGILLLLAFIMLGFTTKLPPAIQQTWYFLLPVIVALFLLAMLAPLMQNFWLKLVGYLPFGNAFKKRMSDFLIGTLDGIRVFYNVRLLVIFFLMSFFVWIMDAVGIVLLARAFGSELSIPQATIFVAALGFASSVPSTPGFVGVYQAVAVLLLPVFGVSEHRAFLLVTFFQLMFLVVTLATGGTGWFVMQRRIGAARLEKELAEAE